MHTLLALLELLIEIAFAALAVRVFVRRRYGLVVAIAALVIQLPFAIAAIQYGWLCVRQAGIPIEMVPPEQGAILIAMGLVPSAAFAVFVALRRRACAP